MKGTAGLLLLLFAVCGTDLAARAADASVGTDDTAARQAAGAAARAFLGRITDAPAAVEGERLYGIYLDGRHRLRNIGTCRVTVEPANGAFGARWRAGTELSIALGQLQTRKSVTSWLARDLSPIRSWVAGWSADAAGTHVRAETTVIEGNEWVLRRDVDGCTGEARRAYEGPLHPSGVVWILLAEAAGRMGNDTVPLLLLRSGSETGADTQPVLTSHDLWIKTGPLTDVPYRGTTARARRIEFAEQDGYASTLVVDSSGRVLQLALEQHLPAILIAADRENMTADITLASESELHALDEIMAVVRRYLEVISKVRPVAELDGCMDWETIRDDMARTDPQLAAFTPAAVGEALKSSLAAAPAVAAGRIDLMLLMMEPDIAGEAARVALPGGDGSEFLLRRADGRWWITRFPR